MSDQERDKERLGEPNCRLNEVAEAAREGRKPETSLGIVACIACNGIFDVHFDPGDKRPRVENLVYIPCLNGYSNNPEAHLDE